MRQRVRYRRCTVELTNLLGERKVLKGKCLSCNHKGHTELHHYKYAYKTSEVRANPLLALDNTIELCYRCHRMADNIRKIDEDTDRYLMVNRAIAKSRPLTEDEELNKVSDRIKSDKEEKL